MLDNKVSKDKKKTNMEPIPNAVRTKLLKDIPSPHFQENPLETLKKKLSQVEEENKTLREQCKKVVRKIKFLKFLHFNSLDFR